MNFTKAITTLTLLLTLTVAVSAQAVYVLRDPALGTFEAEGFYLPSAAYPAGANAANPRVPTLALPHFAAGATAPGDYLAGQGGLAVNQVTGTMISSDGHSIWEEPHPRYPSAWIPLAPVASTSFSMNTQTAHTMSLTYSPIMGLTMDDNKNVLWICEAEAFKAFDAVYPYAPVGGTVWPSFAHSYFTGIAFDSADNTLWLSDIDGHVYHVELTGIAIGAQPVASVPVFLKGIAVDNGNGVGSWPDPACSTSIPGFHVMVTDGDSIIDPLSGASLPLALAGNETYGLAFSSDAQYSHGRTFGSSSGMRIDRPMITGVGLIQMRLEGAAPFTPARLLFGYCPAFPGFAYGGGHVRVFTPVVSTITDAAGTATVMIPALPAGFEFTLQWVHLDTIRGTTTIGRRRHLTDAMTLTTSLR